MKKTYRFYVSGHVQGVNYRSFVKKIAEKYNLTGYVKNLPDGRVEVVVNLDESMLTQFILKLYEGSPFSKVRDVKYEEIQEQDFYDFKIY
ncbi:MAG: acylphosphatase [Candidatus Woesearchaeota archaeon]